MGISDRSDEELVEGFAGRDPGLAGQGPECFAELYRRCAAKVLWSIKRRLSVRHHNDIDDIAQQTWMEVHRSVATSFQGGQFVAWLLGVAYNRVRNHVSRPAKAPSSDTLDPPDNRNPLDELIDHESSQRFRDCFSRLHERDQSILNHLFAGRKYDEFCPILGLDVDAAYTYSHRAKRSLRDCMGESQA